MIITGVNSLSALVTVYFMGVEPTQIYSLQFETLDELFKRIEMKLLDISRNTKSGVTGFNITFKR